MWCDPVTELCDVLVGPAVDLITDLVPAADLVGALAAQAEEVLTRVAAG